MADFKTHFQTGLAAGYAAGVVSAVGPWWQVSPVTPFFVFAGVSAGSLLPDLDSDHSTPFTVAFSLLALIGGSVAFLCCVQQDRLTWPMWVAIPPAAALIIRYGVGWIFQKLTVHRGIFHSIPMALIVTCAASLALTALPVSRTDRTAVALAVGLGFLVHLVLDELYSVNFEGMSLDTKKSFGTALTLKGPSWISTAGAYGILVTLIYLNYRFYTQPVPIS